MLIGTQCIHFNFENGEIFFYEMNNTAIKYDPKELKKEEKELEDFVKEAKNTITEDIVDLDGYVETQINIGNSVVQKRF